MPDGSYWWQVRAQDSQGYTSNWSTSWQLTIDRVAPSTSLDTNGFDINETVANSGFEAGLTGWTTQGDVSLLSSDSYDSAYEGSLMVRLGTPESFAGEVSGNTVWTNKISQRLSPGTKNLSFMYNLYSFDTTGFDDPAIYVNLNDYAVYKLTASEIDLGGNPNQSGWQQISFDLTGINDPVLEIIFYAGNTDDDQNQSWLYLDNITTSEAQVNDSSSFNLTASDSLSGVVSTEYSLDGLTWNSGTSFQATTLLDGNNTVYFRSTDNAGNVELAKQRIVIKNNLAPDAITDLFATATSKHTIDLDWTAPGDNGGVDQVSLYDIRYSLTDVLTDADFNNASSVTNSPAPMLPGEFETFTITGLDSDTEYFFAIKSGDAVNNWSDLSNSSSDTTLDGIADPWINYGDVVLNELMWMGSSSSTADEYLELRNLTDQDIDLSDWVIEGAALSGGDLVIPFGSIIPANGYFLITNFDPTDTSSKLHDTNVIPDWITTSLTLHNQDAQYTLTDDTSFIIDIADDGDGQPFVGDSNLFYAMERNTTPGEGTDASSWHTIFDDSLEVENYWDAGATEKGTPGGRNLSQVPIPPASLVLSLNDLVSEASFTLIEPDLSKFTSLEYTLTYDSLSGTQGITSVKDIDQSETITISNLILGTCSTGGNCTYHQKSDNFNLTVTLTGSISRTYETTL